MSRFRILMLAAPALALLAGCADYSKAPDLSLPDKAPTLGKSSRERKAEVQAQCPGTPVRKSRRTDDQWFCDLKKKAA